LRYARLPLGFLSFAQVKKKVNPLSLTSMLPNVAFHTKIFNTLLISTTLSQGDGDFEKANTFIFYYYYCHFLREK